jgi:streptogramin lyase
METPAILRRLALACAFTFAATGHAADALPSTRALPADWYPESIAVGPDGSFYVGSWRQGAVARLRPGADQPEVLVAPGSNGLSNGQGVLVDSRRGLLWVCSGTLGYTTVPTHPSALKSYDLTSGTPRASYELPDKGYCNDLAQDAKGDIYVTDSFQPRVFRWRDGDAALELWKQDAAFNAGPEGFKLNGIAIDRNHVYVSTVTAAPYLLRIDMEQDGSAGAVTRIDMPRTLKNADAIRSAGSDRLVIFESNAFGHNGPYGGEISLATLAGNRASKLVTLVTGLNDPSSGVIANGRVYYIESKSSLLFAHKGDDAGIPRHVPFDVQSIPLPR